MLYVIFLSVGYNIGLDLFFPYGPYMITQVEFTSYHDSNDSDSIRTLLKLFII